MSHQLAGGSAGCEEWCAIPYGIATHARTSHCFESEMNTRKGWGIT
ncbi:hypothetical protein QUA13_24490 [Microcoleus sp. S28C3]